MTLSITEIYSYGQARAHVTQLELEIRSWLASFVHNRSLFLSARRATAHSQLTEISLRPTFSSHLGGEDRSETCARRERGLVDPGDPRWSPENRPYVVTSKAAGGRIWVDVFDLATCRDQSDIQQFFPGIKVVQTPILGIWSLGHLTEVLQGFYARERALDVVRKGSVQG